MTQANRGIVVDHSAVAEHLEIQAAASRYPRFLATLMALYEGRGCDPVQGEARAIVARALGIEPESVQAERGLTWERLPSGEFAWLRVGGSR